MVEWKDVWYENAFWKWCLGIMRLNIGMVYVWLIYCQKNRDLLEIARTGFLGRVVYLRGIAWGLKLPLMENFHQFSMIFQEKNHNPPKKFWLSNQKNFNPLLSGFSLVGMYNLNGIYNFNS